MRDETASGRLGPSDDAVLRLMTVCSRSVHMIQELLHDAGNMIQKQFREQWETRVPTDAEWNLTRPLYINCKAREGQWRG